MRPSRSRTPGWGRWCVGFVGIVVLLGGCAPATAGPGRTPSASAHPSASRTSSAPVPTSSPAPRLVASATVLDDGSGPELCLGLVMTSLPPQCGGLPIDGWSWPRAGTERASGVTWGSFFVVGHYDGKRFAFERTVTAAQAASSLPTEPDPGFASPCPEPAGGWRAVDPSRATADDREEAFGRAAHLPGYGGAFLDDRGDTSQDPQTSVVNVQVTGDVASAERQLRRVWGGPLCVTTAEHSEQQLLGVLDHLSQRRDLLSGSITDDAVELLVSYDDGTLQRRLDQQYGAGLVRVDSALRPYVG